MSKKRRHGRISGLMSGHLNRWLRAHGLATSGKLRDRLRLFAEHPDAPPEARALIDGRDKFDRYVEATQVLGGDPSRFVNAPPKPKKPKKVKKYRPSLSENFYDSEEWKQLRYKALVKHGAACQCCGRSRKDGVVIHVDHIKPRFHFPELELDFENLQVLCADCNQGKRHLDQTDWR
jgi:hypothetical protein